MRRILLVLALVALASATGCLISTQDGERTHVNAPPPEEISFHFDTQFNKVLVYGRSLALLLIPLWLIASHKSGPLSTLTIVVGASAIVIAGWLYWTGTAKAKDYRIEVRKEHLQLNFPSEGAVTIGWNEIEEMEGEGRALDTTFGDGKFQAVKWSPQWEDLRITLTDGTRRRLDLRPLSVEQRGTLMRAIADRARLQGEVTIIPDR